MPFLLKLKLYVFIMLIDPITILIQVEWADLGTNNSWWTFSSSLGAAVDKLD